MVAACRAPRPVCVSEKYESRSEERRPARHPSQPWDDDGHAVQRPCALVLAVPHRERPSLTTVVRRASDMVRLRFHFYNLRLAAGGGAPRLVRQNPPDPARIVVHFPPQSLLEEAVAYKQDGQGNDATPVPGAGTLQARLSGESRLGFTVPDEIADAGIPYTVEGLLAWASWDLQVPPGARQARGDPPPLIQPPRGGQFVLYSPRPPGAVDTSIEAPWWLQISPNRRAGWINATTPVSKPVPAHAGSSDRVELWHTRLGTRRPRGAQGGLTEPREEPSADRVIRAVWSPDPELPALLVDPTSASDGPIPFLAAMTQKERLSIIRLTTDYAMQAGYTPQPVRVETLALSALGASLAADGSWPVVNGVEIDLLAWRHRSTYGRDHYVRIVERGHLMPFGHQCVLITITERTFMGQGAARVAPLERRQFIVVTQRVLDYAGDDGSWMLYDGRDLPFRSVRLRTITSPMIDQVPLALGSSSVIPIPGAPQPPQESERFFPVLAGTTQDVLWHATATDWEGGQIDLVMPMAFVAGSVAENKHPNRMPLVRAAWNALEHPERGWAKPQSQRIAFSAPLAGQPGSTSLPTERIRLLLAGVQNEAQTQPADGLRLFFPSVSTADVRLDAVESVSGNAFGPGPVGVRYDETYLTSGFAAANAGGVYLELLEAKTLSFSREPDQATTAGKGADKSGGVLTPELVINGLSRSVGLAAGDLAALRQGSFNAAAFFAKASPRLLGGIALAEVIETVGLPAGQAAPPTALQVTHRRTTDAMEARIRWQPTLVPDAKEILKPQGTLRLDAVIKTPLDGRPGTSLVEGDMRDFAVNVPTGPNRLITIAFHCMAFTSRDGKKPDVEVKVKGVSFSGELQWIEELRKYLSFGGGSGPDIKVLPDRIEAGIGVTLPSIALGVFALRNIAFSAAFDIPLTGDPARVRFSLSSRENPFRLTVFLIGGGGYVVVGLGADGLERLEMGFEGGAEIAVDFGPASGSISMTFGIVLLFIFTDGSETASFLGEFRLHGEVSAGPVSASVGLHLALGYVEKKKNNKTIKSMYGKGTIYIDVSIPLVPTPTIKITFERNFKSAKGDPTFADQMRPVPSATESADWNTYCSAFAAA